jgi:GTPase SAR1 family protein
MESSAVSLSFKIVLLGDASVGKTSLLHRLTNDSFTEET